MLVDVHGHLGRVVPDRREFIDAANVIAKMDAWGVDRTCLLPLSEQPEGGYLECDTEDVLAACARYPDRLIPFCCIDPRCGNRPDHDFGPLLDEYCARGCRGLGELLPKLPFDDPRCLNLYRQAGAHGLPVLFDLTDGPHGYGLCDEPGLPRLERALRLCEGTTFIGHGPTFWAEISSAVPAGERAGYPAGPVAPGGAVPRLMRRYANLWADTSAGSGYNALSRDPSFGREFLEEFQDQMMFGIDSCRRSDLEHPPPQVAWMADLRAQRLLPEAALEKLAWRNAARLLGPLGG